MIVTANLGRLRAFIEAFAELLSGEPAEALILEKGARLLSELVTHDDWLPEEYAQPDPQRYRQFLLHADSQQRFSVVSFVWGPGQSTPIHDHRVWGLIGLLRGGEHAEGFQVGTSGELQAHGAPTYLKPGQVESVSPLIGDIHRVSTAFADRVSISIHVYGANIGAVPRAVYEMDGSQKSFISGYSNIHLPNIWDLSKEPHHS